MTPAGSCRTAARYAEAVVDPAEAALGTTQARVVPLLPAARAARPRRRRQGPGDPGPAPAARRAAPPAPRPKPEPADRALSAAISRVPPRFRWSCFVATAHLHEPRFGQCLVELGTPVMVTTYLGSLRDGRSRASVASDPFLAGCGRLPHPAAGSLLLSADEPAEPCLALPLEAPRSFASGLDRRSAWSRRPGRPSQRRTAQSARGRTTPVVNWVMNVHGDWRPCPTARRAAPTPLSRSRAPGWR